MVKKAQFEDPGGRTTLMQKSFSLIFSVKRCFIMLIFMLLLEAEYLKLKMYAIMYFRYSTIILN